MPSWADIKMHLIMYLSMCYNLVITDEVNKLDEFLKVP